jgi:hypothetical protein
VDAEGDHGLVDVTPLTGSELEDDVEGLYRSMT